MQSNKENTAILQRDKTTYAIAPHVPCGIITPQILRRLADAAEKYHASVVKITNAQRIALIGIEERDIDKAWEDLGTQPASVVGLCVRSVKACPGNQYCHLGQQDSLKMGMRLNDKYHGLRLPAKLKMGVSGCAMQCAETCIKDIGLVGSRNGWKVLAGGNGGPRPRLSQEVAKELSNEEALAMIDRIIAYFKKQDMPKKRLGAILEKNGFEAFKAEMNGQV